MYTFHDGVGVYLARPLTQSVKEYPALYGDYQHCVWWEEKDHADGKCRCELDSAPFTKMGNGDSLRSGHTQRDNEKEGGAIFVGIANSILWALCNSFVFFWSRICRPL